MGEIVGGGLRLTFDYGGFAWSLSPADDPAHEYVVSHEEINGREAKLILPKGSTEGFTGVHFPHLPIPALTITGTDLTLDQQRTAFAIFRSIDSLGGLVKIQVNFDTLEPVLEPGVPTPKLIIDVLDSGSRFQVMSKSLKKESDDGGGTLLSPTGQYERWLGPGTYVLDIINMWDFVTNDVPKTFTIDTGEQVELEIDLVTAFP